MRFHRGEFPVDSRFNPEAEGWLALPETNPGAVNRLAMPAALGLLLLWLLLAFLVFPLELLTPQAIRISDTAYQIRFPVYEALTRPLTSTLIVISILEDPEHLAQPVITSSNFKREPDGSKWAPSDCLVG